MYFVHITAGGDADCAPCYSDGDRSRVHRDAGTANRHRVTHGYVHCYADFAADRHADGSGDRDGDCYVHRDAYPDAGICPNPNCDAEESHG